MWETRSINLTHGLSWSIMYVYIKMFLKIDHSKSILNFRSHQSFIVLKHTTLVMWQPIMTIRTNYVCMYVKSGYNNIILTCITFLKNRGSPSPENLYYCRARLNTLSRDRCRTALVSEVWRTNEICIWTFTGDLETN